MHRVPRGYYYRGQPAPTDLDLTSGPRKLQSGEVRTFARTFQEVTFVLSIVLQITGLVMAIIALYGGGHVPPALRTILLLEFVVQLIELAWYAIVGGLYQIGQLSFNIGVRYIDWFFTTPVMLTSILLYMLFETEQCSTAAEILAVQGRWVGLIGMVVLNFFMLLAGFTYEAKVETLMPLLNRITPCISSSNPNRGLVWGFVPFFGVFSLYLPYIPSWRGWGGATIGITFGLWFMYGVVAVGTLVMGWGGNDPTERDQFKNGAYNVLDLISKNGVGILLSALTIGTNYTNGTCVNGTYPTS